MSCMLILLSFLYHAFHLIAFSFVMSIFWTHFKAITTTIPLHNNFSIPHAQAYTSCIIIRQLYPRFIMHYLIWIDDPTMQDSCHALQITDVCLLCTEHFGNLKVVI